MIDRTEILESIKDRQQVLERVSDSIWEFAETRYEEYHSAALLCSILEEEGFAVTKGLAGMETAFMAAWGSGAPVVGFLGEYDALYGLSQEAGTVEKKPITEGGTGHGCGHHALGTGSLAAALALKDYMISRGLSGTVRYYGCPAEEGGCGKVYLARAGLFRDADAVFTWHPFTTSTVMTFNVLATMSAYFKFHGKSSHAAGAPHMGRSALDAVELMNVGVNFLREHVESDVRLHYAITDTGGKSPNVVQSEAAVLHQIRAPRIAQVREVFERVKKIAQGAALMTETEVEIVFDKASSDLLHNNTLESLVHETFLQIGQVPIDEEDIDYARRIRRTLSDAERQLDRQLAASMFGKIGEKAIEKCEGEEIVDTLFPYEPSDIVAMGSSDLGDVSWNVPAVSFQVVSYAKDTAPHSWQQVAQGKTPLIHKAILHAGKIMALAAAEFLENERLRKRVREEFDAAVLKHPYICPIPPEVKPSPAR